MIMGWSIDETLGKLHRFWWWCLDYAPTGDLRTVNWMTLGILLGLTADDSTKFRDALVSTHLVCRLTRTRLPFRIHDWVDYAGRYLRDTKFKRSPEKWAQVVELYKTSCQPTVSRQSADMSMEKRKTPGHVGCTNLTNLTNQPNQPEEESRDVARIASPPIQVVVNRWNAIPGVKPCKNVEGKLATRLNSLLTAKDDSWWDAFFAEVEKSRFLTGQVAPTNGRRQFRADLFWATGPENLAKIVSGKYDDTGERIFDPIMESAMEFLQKGTS